MKISSQSMTDGARMDPRLAFATIDPATHVALSDNRNPELSWAGAPENTASFVILCHDPDVPSVGDDVNQEGRVVPVDLPRVDFFHWVLVDIPSNVTSIAEGLLSNGVTAKGKEGPQVHIEALAGARQGVNNYTDWFAGDEAMGGDYHGYDGPGPPWNDERLHHYVFTVYALDIAQCDVTGRFGGPEVLAAIEGHILASGSITGTYTLNPSVS